MNICYVRDPTSDFFLFQLCVQIVSRFLHLQSLDSRKLATVERSIRRIRFSRRRSTFKSFVDLIRCRRHAVIVNVKRDFIELGEWIAQPDW